MANNKSYKTMFKCRCLGVGGTFKGGLIISTPQKLYYEYNIGITYTTYPPHIAHS